jgi:hypothetical protein
MAVPSYPPHIPLWTECGNPNVEAISAKCSGTRGYARRAILIGRLIPKHGVLSLRNDS